MRKKIFILSMPILLLAACAPAQAPSPTEMPAVEYYATEEPVEVVDAEPVQKEGRITIFYKMSEDLPTEWIVKDNQTEALRFVRTEDGSWSTETASPLMPDLGPLFFTSVSNSLRSSVGDCPINTYHPNEENGYSLSFQPLCSSINSEESATLTLSVGNCQRDVRKNLSCSKESSWGTLYYLLNPELDKFQFTYDGTWNFEYENWIRVSLRKLDFQEIPVDFFDDNYPGASRTLYKE